MLAPEPARSHALSVKLTNVAKTKIDPHFKQQALLKSLQKLLTAVLPSS